MCTGRVVVVVVVVVAMYGKALHDIRAAYSTLLLIVPTNYRLHGKGVAGAGRPPSY